MFGRIPQTDFDLQFPVFGIPVRVHPFFWLAGAIMGYSQGWAQALQVNPLGVVCLWWCVTFVSILVHEFGHAIIAEYFGWRSNILLYHFGGLAYYDPIRGHTPWKRVAISIAGPGAGFILYGLVVAFEFVAAKNGWFDDNMIYFYLILQLKFVNLWWGLINLLPVMPLDGGNICTQLLHIFRVRNADVLAHKIGMVVAGVAALFFFSQQRRYAGILFLFLAFNNYNATQQRYGGGGW